METTIAKDYRNEAKKIWILLKRWYRMTDMTYPRMDMKTQRVISFYSREASGDYR